MPYALPAICLDIGSAEAQLGQVHATLPPLAALHQMNPKAARTSELRKPNKNITDEGPIWPADSRGAGNSPETYTIPGDKVVKVSRVSRDTTVRLE